MDRKDLLFNTSTKKNRSVITFFLGSPHFRKWINQEMPILHEEPKLRKLLPKKDVVTRQAPNIKKKFIRSRHWRKK